MNQCMHDRREQYLAGALSGQEEAAFVAHLDTCPVCQKRLEEEAASGEAWLTARELLASSCPTDSKANPVANWHEERDAHDIRAYSELALLHPSDDPAMLGRLGGLEVIGILGRGGMGVVFKCFDPALRRNVAVKLLAPALANHGAARQRFAREARAMAAISHENVVPIYAVDEHAELPYLVMEYVPGGTLERRLAQRGPLQVVEVIRVGLQVAAALAAAHRQGLVHRDIKPSNILLDQGTERVRVADFGLAQAADDGNITHSGMLAGTPQYMAPEQVRGEACDAQSDLFSLGSLMYALCVGHPPFRAQTVYAVMQRIVHDEPRSLREQDGSIPTWLEEFVFRLLAKDRESRFASAAEVLAILESELAYHQSPRAGSEPARVWRRACNRLTPWPAPRWYRGAWIASAVVLTIAGGFGLTYAVLSGSGGSAEIPPASQPAASQPVDAAASTVPLWDADGMSESLAAARKLEAQSQRIRMDSEFDFWHEQTEQIQQRLDELSSSSDVWNSTPP